MSSQNTGAAHEAARHKHRRRIYGIERLERRLLLNAQLSFDAGHVYSAPGYIPNVMAVGNFNGDAYPDIVADTYQGGGTNPVPVNVLLGNGDGTFHLGSTFTIPAEGNGIDERVQAVRAGDFNSDGKSDAVVGVNELVNQQKSYRVYILLGNGDGTLRGPVSDPNSELAAQGGLSDVQLGDFNRDGKLDLLLVTSEGSYLKYGNGDGTFYTGNKDTTIGSAFGNGLIADVNGDGRPDLLVADAPDPNSSLAGQLNVDLQDANNFLEVPRVFPLKTIATQLGAADFNGDGKLDIAVVEEAVAQTSALRYLEVLSGDGAGNFTSTWSYPLTLPPRGMAIGDFDGDFLPDIVIGTRDAFDTTSGAFLFFHNNGDGTFSPPQRVPVGPDNPVNLTSADFNQDGKPDVAVQLLRTESLATFLNTAVFQNLVTGRVYNDANRNATFDPGESGLGGHTVYIDSNDNGVLDPGEISTTTAADGTYKFLLPTGNYLIREVLPPGWIETGVPGPSGKTFAYTVNLPQAHQKSPGWNFGDYFQGTISGQVFNDQNANGTFDVFESAVPGRTVYVDANDNGVLDAGEVTAVTDSLGFYHFNLPPGTYRLRQVLPAGWHQTTPTNVTGKTGSQLVTITSTNAAMGVNFGATQLGSLSGRVYYDIPASGISLDTDPGLSGFTVYIDSNNNGALDPGEPRATTDAQGHWSIGSLYPGNYTVRLVKPAGWAITEPAPTPTGQDGYYATMAVGGVDGVYTDFGVIHPSYVSGVVFNDRNGNGVQDVGDFALPNWEVFVDLNGNGIPDLGEPYTMTDAQGNYRLRSPVSGNYAVRVVKQSGWNATVPVSASYTVSFVPGAADVTGKNFGFTQAALNQGGFLSAANLPSASNPTAVATGDFNKDGKLDFAALNNSGNIAMFLGDGTGKFAASSAGVTGASPRDLIAADLIGNGKLDLITANQDDGTVSVLLGNGDGTFKPKIDYPAVTGADAVVAADFNGDGKLDLAVGGNGSDSVVILPGKGDGTFGPPQSYPAVFNIVVLAAGDLNGDGTIDLVAASSVSGALAILFNNDNHSFQPPQLLDSTRGVINPRSVATGDLNGDGKLDLAVTNEYSDNVVVLTGKGDGSFNPPGAAPAYATGSFPAQVSIADVNGDGKPDLIIACRSDGTTDISGGVSVLLGHGDGSFADQLTTTTHTSPIAVAAADLNGDGLPDLIAANFYSDDVSVLLNGRAPHLGSISGSVFRDANYNGSQDAGEGGLGGWQVFLDLNHDGTLDPADPTAITGADGSYTFSGLQPGTYLVRQVLPAGWARTTPLIGSAAVMVSGQSAAGPRFGNVPLSSVTLGFPYLVTLARHYGQPGTFAMGDLDGDGNVDFNDLVLLARNYGHSLSSPALAFGAVMPAIAHISLARRPHRSFALTE